MDAKELPQSELLVTSADINIIAEALRTALEGSMGVGYRYTADIAGGTSSGLVLAPQAYLDAESLPKMLTSTQMAKWLMDKAKWNLEYDEPPNKEMRRGLEVHKAITEDGPIAIIWAAWVPAPPPPMPRFF